MNTFWNYWGKARPVDGSTAAFHRLPYHCLDVAAVGSVYLESAPGLCRWLSRMLGVAREGDLVAWVSFWLCLHDLGKYSEAFQGQRPDVFERLRGRAQIMEYTVRHDTLGRVVWTELLEQIAIDDEWLGPLTEDHHRGLRAWVRAVTGHHGQPPKSDPIRFEHHFDKTEDSAAIVSLVREVKSLMLGDVQPLLPTRLDADEFCDASERLSWWIAGLAVLADWIGSNTEYFEYRDQPPADGRLDEYWLHAKRCAQRALAATGVLPALSPSRAGLGTLFPKLSRPSPLQAWASDCQLPTEPALVMLEDVTGAGKTEAALMLAHRLMSSGLADGFFIGLPTMATANAMYGRIAEAFERLFGHDASLALAHGQSFLVEAFAKTVLRAGPAEGDATQYDETATARCTAWLADHNKRALIAAAGVGTIDQAMLGVLHSKHQSLRLLGLFRKVLIVDEVHACDPYMQRVLESLLEFHAYSGGCAVLLSATLPQGMKKSLLSAYARGRGLAVAERALPAPSIESNAFPLATVWHSGAGSHASEQPLASRPEVCRSVAVRYASERQNVITMIEGALAQGRCVCWMRNTVADALDAFDELRGRLGDDRITLFHARFALKDRLAIESHILERFGPNSAAEQRRGQLVIATQVVEQSLDADWDVVVSDLAPIDRLIQRAGRLQRHVRDAAGNRLDEPGARDQRGEPCLWVHGPAWSEAPPANWFKAALPKAAFVYPHHGQLWLAAKALQAGRMRMPEDARQLIEGVFDAAATFPAALDANATRAEGNDLAARSQGGANVVKLTQGYARGDVIDWWSEARTPSRLGEASITVVLARWAGDRLLPWVEHASATAAWAYSSVRVPQRLIAQRATGGTPQREVALCATEAEMPGAGKWSVLLPLEPAAGGAWQGGAMSAEQKRQPAKSCMWTYASTTGLMPIQNTEEDSE
jgi:CRISPR-associated endonuclease/helicase Cas3